MQELTANAAHILEHPARLATPQAATNGSVNEMTAPTTTEPMVFPPANAEVPMQNEPSAVLPETINPALLMSTPPPRPTFAGKEAKKRLPTIALMLDEVSDTDSDVQSLLHTSPIEKPVVIVTAASPAPIQPDEQMSHPPASPGGDRMESTGAPEDGPTSTSVGVEPDGELAVRGKKPAAARKQIGGRHLQSAPPHTSSKKRLLPRRTQSAPPSTSMHMRNSAEASHAASCRGPLSWRPFCKGVFQTKEQHTQTDTVVQLTTSEVAKGRVTRTTGTSYANQTSKVEADISAIRDNLTSEAVGPETGQRLQDLGISLPIAAYFAETGVQTVPELISHGAKRKDVGECVHAVAKRQKVSVWEAVIAKNRILEVYDEISGVKIEIE